MARKSAGSRKSGAARTGGGPRPALGRQPSVVRPAGGRPAADARRPGWPEALRPTVALVAVEGVALVALGLGYAAYAAGGKPQNLLGAEITAGFAVAAGAVLVLLARGLARRRTAARTPTVVLQLLALPIGWYQLTGGLPLVGTVVLALALAVLTSLAMPGARAALTPRSR